MNMKKKTGFIAIEIVIVAAVLLSVGAATISALSVGGLQRVSEGVERFGDGLFNLVDADEQESELIDAYPVGTVIDVEQVNSDFDFDYLWNHDLRGWTITSYNNVDKKTLIIPPTRIDGSPIVAIADSAFMNMRLTSVALPNTVVAIGNSSFRNNDIQTLLLPANLVTVDASAFRDNEIQKLVIPPTVASIDSHAFRKNDLTSIVLQGSIPLLGAHVFNNNPGLLPGSILVPHEFLQEYRDAARDLGLLPSHFAGY